MIDINRRNFIKNIGVGAAGAVTIGGIQEKSIHSIFYGNPWSAVPLCTANCAIHKGIALLTLIY